MELLLDIPNDIKPEQEGTPETGNGGTVFLRHQKNGNPWIPRGGH